MKKRYLLSLVLATVVIGIVSYAGFTFAWYQVEDSGTEVEVTSEEINVNYTTTNVIKNTVGIPILDSQVSTKADKCTMIVDVIKMTEGYDYGFDLAFKDITLDPALKITDFKWEVLKNGVSVANGDFSSVDGSNYLLYSEKFSYIQTNSYEIRVWLRETNQPQNELMGKSFKAKVETSSYLESK